MGNIQVTITAHNLVHTVHVCMCIHAYSVWLCVYIRVILYCRTHYILCTLYMQRVLLCCISVVCDIKFNHGVLYLRKTDSSLEKRAQVGLGSSNKPSPLALSHDPPLPALTSVVCLFMASLFPFAISGLVCILVSDQDSQSECLICIQLPLHAGSI